MAAIQIEVSPYGIDAVLDEELMLSVRFDGKASGLLAKTQRLTPLLLPTSVTVFEVEPIPSL